MFASQPLLACCACWLDYCYEKSIAFQAELVHTNCCKRLLVLARSILSSWETGSTAFAYCSSLGWCPGLIIPKPHLVLQTAESRKFDCHAHDLVTADHPHNQQLCSSGRMQSHFLPRPLLGFPVREARMWRVASQSLLLASGR